MSETLIINKPNTETVVPIQDVSSGSHLEEFIAYLKDSMGISDESARNIRNTSCDILSHCNPHDAVSNMDTTHLAVGYVQSGKTMSFTSLIELALDYKYRIVIVFAGVTTSLLKQTTDRLRKDLRCGNPLNNKFFKIHKNASTDDKGAIAVDLKNKKSIVIIPVLKHWDRIAKLSELFEDEDIKSLLESETALIIDDEADQASLNNYGRKNSKDEDNTQWNFSTTFASIMRLRLALDGNSYVQYTATPQANILISQLDMLSPKSHTLLYPGEGYCGGKVFFGIDGVGALFNGKLVKRIPEDEVFNKKENALESIPSSLEDAIIQHMWAVTLILRWFQVKGINQLSMMVHVDETISWNKVFCDWISNTIQGWQEIYHTDEEEKRLLLDAKFRIALNEAARLYDDVPSFDELRELLIETIDDTRVYRITGESGDMENLEWNDYTSNILVGAQMLNRGFTVENLTTTYMPRYATSVVNADTIEQRCRFFGYKMKYIKSVKVYLPQISIDNYRAYVKSEEELRFAMASTNDMETLGHKILTSPKLQPTRKAVLPCNVVTDTMKGMHEFSSYAKSSVMEHNRKIVEAFYDKYDEWTPFVSSNYDPIEYTGMRLHHGLRISVNEAIDLLKNFIFTELTEKRYAADTIRYLYYLSQLSNDPITEVQIIMMGSGNKKERSLGHDNKLTSNLFTGPSAADQSTNYPGDRNIYARDTITFQLHRVYLVDKDFETISLAIHYPEKLAGRYVSTENNN